MSYFPHIDIVQSVRPERVRLRELVGTYDHTLWLLEGAPELPGLSSPAPYDVRWLVTQAQREFVRTLVDHPEYELRDVLRDTSNRLQARYRQQAAVPRRRHWPAASLAMVRYFRRENKLYWLVVGNTTLAIGNPRQNRLQVLADDRLDHYAESRFAQLYLLQRSGLGFTHAAFQDTLRRLVVHERATLNVRDTHYLLLPEHFELDWARTGWHVPTPGDQVFLLSDGALRHWQPFGLCPDVRTLCGRFAAGQGERLVAEVRAAESADPEGVQAPRRTRHANITMVRATLRESAA